jgi:hypothetical protein
MTEPQELLKNEEAIINFLIRSSWSSTVVSNPYQTTITEHPGVEQNM